MENLQIDITPDSTFGFAVQVKNESRETPKVVVPTLQKAFDMIESESFHIFVEVFLKD